MKNYKKVLGVFGILLILGLVVAGCGDLPDDDDGGNGDVGNYTETIPPAKGKLTITGLSQYNGKYIYVDGFLGSQAAEGFIDITKSSTAEPVYTLTKITNGEAVVPLYNIIEKNYIKYYAAYTGDDTLISLSDPTSNQNRLYVSYFDDADGSINVSALKGTSSQRMGWIPAGNTFSGGNLTVNYQASQW